LVKSKLIKVAISKLNQIIDQEVQNLDLEEQERIRKAEKNRRSTMLLSGKYDFFEKFKAEMVDQIDKNKMIKENEAHHANGYIKKLLINIGHMESQTALETFRKIPNAEM
jgi:hypothetical protein